MKSLGANHFFLKILDKFRGKNLIIKKSGAANHIFEKFRKL